MVLSLLLGGCKVGPNYAGPPTPPTPREWTQNHHEASKPQMPALDDWWVVFDDPTLNTILANVNEQNLSLRAAAWKIYQARADLCATRGDLFPAIGTDASYSLLKTSGDGLPRGTDLVSQSWDWGVSANWEIDIFGQIKRYVEAAQAELDATQEDYRNVKMILMADTARTYIDARLYQKRMQIVQDNIAQQEDYLKIIEARYRAGKDDRLAYAQACANLSSVKASYPSLQSGYRECVNRLSVLMGCPPGTVDEIMERAEPIPVAPDAMAVGIPADLLRRRPDIRGLERRLAAQTARIGIAEAELYPKFYINGSFGLQAENFSDLFNGRSTTASLMPSLQWRLLEFGRIRCTIMKQEGLTEQMKYEYQEAVLEAAEEVDNAIANFVRLQERTVFLEKAVQEHKETWDLSKKLYNEGRSDYLPVLDAQRNVLEYEEMLSTARANLATSVVQLYRALGGGWQVDPVASSTTQQIDRFRNRHSGPVSMSAHGEGVNTRGSVRERSDLTPDVSTPSTRVRLDEVPTTLTPGVHSGATQAPAAAALPAPIAAQPAPATRRSITTPVDNSLPVDVPTELPVPPAPEVGDPLLQDLSSTKSTRHPVRQASASVPVFEIQKR
ncbi:MAG: efflux transporter outer membrane subunit [Planctomycetia bacterium]|nr:efflux transporter outer membrane subunit [Planctomycetia bacterium]